jgi:hypothetical protein
MARIIIMTGLISLDDFKNEMPAISRKLGVEDRSKGIRM